MRWPEKLDNVAKAAAESSTSLRHIYDTYNNLANEAGWAFYAGCWHVARTASDNVLIRECRVAYREPAKQTMLVDALWNSIIKNKLPLPESVVVTVGVTEAVADSKNLPKLVDQHRRYLKFLVAQQRIKNYALIVSINIDYKALIELRKQSDVIVVPWFLMNYSSMYPARIPSLDNKILFTPGKTYNRVDRIHTLLYIANNVEKHQTKWLWSCHGHISVDTHIKEIWAAIIQTLYPELSSTDCSDNPDGQIPALTVAGNRVRRSIDPDTDAMWTSAASPGWQKQNPSDTYSGLHNYTYKIPEAVYQQIAAEYITETWWHRGDHLTEKTFRPILAGRPFIHSNPKHTEWLEIATPFRGYTDLISVNDQPNREFSDPVDQSMQKVTNQVLRSISDAESLQAQLDNPEIERRVQENLDHAYRLISEAADRLVELIPGIQPNSVWFIGRKGWNELFRQQ